MLAIGYICLREDMPLARYLKAPSDHLLCARMPLVLLLWSGRGQY